MAEDAPRPTEDDYPGWLRLTLGVDLAVEDRNYYENTADSLVAQFRNTPFWKDFCIALRDRDQEHKLSTTYPLLAPSNTKTPPILPKPYESIILKSFRRNVLDNKNWPEPPDGGWLVPENWLLKLKDIVRTTVVVKYLDGVEIVCALLQQVADAHGFDRAVEYEARDDGYYAAHSVITVPLRLNNRSWESISQPVSIEIQVTTQVQEVIRALTHKYYEQRRRVVRDESKKWQWSYRSDEFVPNYLGHILHYVEGMIMEIRDKQENADG